MLVTRMDLAIDNGRGGVKPQAVAWDLRSRVDPQECHHWFTLHDFHTSGKSGSGGMEDRILTAGVPGTGSAAHTKPSPLSTKFSTLNCTPA